MHKFQLYCSCITCKAPITTQNIKSHYKKYHSVKEPKSYCLECQEPIYSNNKFCNHSCSAKYNNKKRLESGWKQTEKQRTAARNFGLSRTNSKKHDVAAMNNSNKHSFTRIKYCVICNVPHTRTGKTCSKGCHRLLLSLKMKECMYNNTFNPNKNRGRHKRSYMELSFDQWLIDNYPTLTYITEHPFKRFDYTKTYFADFYFPTLSLIIELDGTQHLKTVEYDSERDEYIKTHYDVDILRISHKEYQNKTKLELVKELLTKAL